MKRTPMPTDAELLHDYSRTGSQNAFAELVRRHVDFVYATALRVLYGDHHLAEDVAQATFVEVARQAAELGVHPSLRGWLHTTAYHLAVRAIRTRRRRIAREEEVATMNENSADPGVDWALLRPVLDETLQELSETDRESILLRFDGKRFAEVGAQLGLGENAARMRVDRALDRLRGLLARRGITSSVAALALVLEQQASAVAAPAGLAARIVAGAGTGTLATAVAGWGIAKLMIAGLAATAVAVAIAVLPRRTEPPAAATALPAPVVSDAASAQERSEPAAFAVAHATAGRPDQPSRGAGRVVRRIVAPTVGGGTGDMLPQLIAEPEVALTEAFGSAVFAGRIIVGFEVDAQGAVLDPYIVRSTAPELDAEALGAASALQFTGGIKRGRAVNTRMCLTLHLGPDGGPPEVAPLLQ